jgi:predicted acylesterase/phospholipase RssA
MSKRALILAGGGLKVAFQAGVLQVWLDEAGITFDHADGASGGCFNLAMYCQQMSGTQIADNWRHLDPFLPIDVNFNSGDLLHALSLFTYDNFRARVLPFWGIDWTRINASPRLCTFNLLNYSKKQLEVVTQERMTEDHLISSVSLPMWFPPVTINGDRYIDAVYVTDGNVEEAIRRGADEIWAIWTVSMRDDWRPGFVSQYFHIIEAVADTNFFGIWRRIEESNRRIVGGGAGEFGRPITLRLLRAEVPIHYLLNFSKDRMHEAVNLGVAAAREWCDEQGISRAASVPVASNPPPPAGAATRLRFTEEMRGHVATAAADYRAGDDSGRADGTSLEVRLTIDVADVDRFVTDPQHTAAIEGTASSPLFGDVNVAEGRFQLLVHGDDPRRKQMKYWLVCGRDDGTQWTIRGFKNVDDDRATNDVWSDTTTLFVDVYEGRVAESANATPAARGIIRIGLVDFLRQLTTFRVEAPSLPQRIEGAGRFGRLFLGKLWDVYGNGLALPG